MTKRNNGHCPHYWMIESANGPMSKGRCILCGAEQVFYNDFEEIFIMKNHLLESGRRGGEKKRLLELMKAGLI